MDPSALIFVALAVAWAVYLIPKALHTSDEGGHAVERLSAGVRVLARRGPVADDDTVAGTPADRSLAKAEARAARKAQRRAARKERRAVRGGARRERRELRRAAVVRAWLAASPAARRHVAMLAARRRRRVLGLTVLAGLVVGGVAASGVIEWYWVAIPVALTLAWLVTCRVMVRRELAVRRAALEPDSLPVAPADVAPDDAVQGPADPEATGEFTAFVDGAEVRYDESGAITGRYDPVTGSWDAVPVQLPTYVNKAAAPRSVRTIDLDSTGVWSSGRSEADSAIAREAEEAASDVAAVEAERAARAANS